MRLELWYMCVLVGSHGYNRGLDLLAATLFVLQQRRGLGVVLTVNRIADWSLLLGSIERSPHGVFEQPQPRLERARIPSVGFHTIGHNYAGWFDHVWRYSRSRSALDRSSLRHGSRRVRS